MRYLYLECSISDLKQKSKAQFQMYFSALEKVFIISMGNLIPQVSIHDGLALQKDIIPMVSSSAIMLL